MYISITYFSLLEYFLWTIVLSDYNLISLFSFLIPDCFHCRLFFLNSLIHIQTTFIVPLRTLDLDFCRGPFCYQQFEVIIPFVDIVDICVTNDHGYVSLVVNISRSFSHSRLINRFVTRLTRRVPLIEKELVTLPEHLNSYSIFSVMCMFCRSLFVLLLLAIVSSVLRYTDSDYLCGILIFFIVLNINGGSLIIT